MNVAGTGMRVVVATRPVDFRKGHGGLAAVVDMAIAAIGRASEAIVAMIRCCSWPMATLTCRRHRKVCTQNCVKHPPVGIYARIFVR